MKLIEIELNEINRKKLNFERIKIEFATKTTFDLIIDSKRNLIDIDVKLKLIVNFLNLNDLKNFFALIFDSKLTTTSTFYLIVFFATIAIFFVFNSFND